MKDKTVTNSKISLSVRNTIERRINRFQKDAAEQLTKITYLSDDWENYFKYYPEDMNLEVEFDSEDDDYDIYCALSDYYEERFKETDKNFRQLLKLIELNYKKDQDINWLLEKMNGLIISLDPFFEDLSSNPYDYTELMADLIITALKQADKKKANDIIEQIKIDYLNPALKNMYTYTMSIVIDELQGKREFNEIYRKRIKIELENSELDDYSRKFLNDELKNLNKKLGY